MKPYYPGVTRVPITEQLNAMEQDKKGGSKHADPAYFKY